MTVLKERINRLEGIKKHPSVHNVVLDSFLVLHATRIILWVILTDEDLDLIPLSKRPYVN